MWQLFMKILQVKDQNELLERENEIEVVCEIIYELAKLPGETQTFIHIDTLYTSLNSIIEIQKQLSQQESYQMDDDYKVFSFIIIIQHLQKFSTFTILYYYIIFITITILFLLQFSFIYIILNLQYIQLLFNYLKPLRIY